MNKKEKTEAKNVIPFSRCFDTISPYDLELILEWLEDRKKDNFKIILEGMMESQPFIKSYLKELNKKSNKDLRKAIAILNQKGISKTWLADITDLHRNTINNYAKS
jgi:hypothetical protein